MKAQDLINLNKKLRKQYKSVIPLSEWLQVREIKDQQTKWTKKEIATIFSVPERFIGGPVYGRSSLIESYRLIKLQKQIL
jgi:hypothetical protein